MTDALTWLGLVAVVVAGYVVSLRLWPYTTCRACGGSGIRTARVFTDKGRAFGLCRACGGKKRQPRLGVRLGLGGRP